MTEVAVYMSESMCVHVFIFFIGDERAFAQGKSVAQSCYIILNSI